jgi:hypothetical protein
MTAVIPIPDKLNKRGMQDKGRKGIKAQKGQRK